MEEAPSSIGNGTVIAAAVAIIFAGLWYALLRPRTGGKDAPPCYTKARESKLPFVGVIAEFITGPNELLTRAYRELGSVFTIPLLHKRLTYLVGPEAQKVFFTASDDVLSQDECYDFMQCVFGKHVVYDATKKNRQVQFQTMANGLRMSRMKTYVGKVQFETEKYFREHWNLAEGESKVVDIFHDMSELTILTASRCLHGDDVRQHIFTDLHRLYHDLDAGLTPLTTLWRYAPTQNHKRRDEARKELVVLFDKVIKERRLHPDRTDGTDILSLFMDIKYKDGSKITSDQITGLLIALLFAGQHTSCITSTWAILYLVHNTDYLKRVNEEQEKLGVRHGKKKEDDLLQDVKLDLGVVNEMELLHNSMREVLRLCPTFTMLLRKALKDVTVTADGKTYVIPKGDIVGVSPTVSMRLDSTFKDADKFDPDRYGPGREEHKEPYAYLGFGGGMHSCMGQSFAYMQVKTIMSVLFANYELTPVAKTLPSINYNAMVVAPDGDCRVRITRKKVSK
eukprot:CAMPEP_0119557582 /NCGR_PEP_ID=MMETSP1352-20130426/9215_1 /TAXON_ID=265584 /ORGANISM="Stauroneis constricta, Strain CCMP1120" /LENGTH=508 /DNA_ID=CAMNT_0007604711 /DNA_START=15 /DNA_END=1541 /DNA_ORIENTATION=-